MYLRIWRLCGFVVTVVGIPVIEAAHALLLGCGARECEFGYGHPRDHTCIIWGS